MNFTKIYELIISQWLNAVILNIYIYKLSLFIEKLVDRLLVLYDYWLNIVNNKRVSKHI